MARWFHRVAQCRHQQCIRLTDRALAAASRARMPSGYIGLALSACQWAGQRPPGFPPGTTRAVIFTARRPARRLAGRLLLPLQRYFVRLRIERLRAPLWLRQATEGNRGPGTARPQAKHEVDRSDLPTTGETQTGKTQTHQGQTDGLGHGSEGVLRDQLGRHKASSMP